MVGHPDCAEIHMMTHPQSNRLIDLQVSVARLSVDGPNRLPHPCYCVLGQGILLTSPHMNISGCLVVVIGSIWHRLATTLQSVCPQAAAATW